MARTSFTVAAIQLRCDLAQRQANLVRAGESIKQAVALGATLGEGEKVRQSGVVSQKF